MSTVEERAKHAAYWREYYKDPEHRQHRRERASVSRRKRLADPLRGDAQRLRDTESRRRFDAKPENQEAKRAYSKQRYAEHPELWQGRDLHFVTQANVRAKKCGVEGRLLRQEVAAITGPCAYCGSVADEWDHVVPMTRGGPNVVANLVPCCRPCNLSKNNRTVEEWMAMKARHRQIIEMVASGVSVTETARRLGISRDNAGSVLYLHRRRGGA